MSRSLQIVENKIEEAEFFLEKLRFQDTDCPRFNIREASFYLSAFLSAARSITFCLQSSLSDLDGFQPWYKRHKANLSANELARFFLEARNLSQKVGYYPLRGARIRRDENGQHHVELYFAPLDESGPVPDADVATACEAHFRQLLEITVDCYGTFGSIIDPEQYYTMENMRRLGLTIEDFEAELGYTPGWTRISGLSPEERIELLREHAPKTATDWIFHKHLGTDRYGLPGEFSDA